MKRRQFIKTTVIGSLATNLGSLPMYAHDAPVPADAVRVNNAGPERMFAEAMSALGGLSRFVSRGDVVVVKPNMGWDRAPEYAANTNPDLIVAIVKACYAAGAKEVKIFDRTCNNPRRCYRNSLIEEMAGEADANVIQIRDNKFKTIQLKNGQMLKEWPIYEDYLLADKVINVPIAKKHSLCQVTLGLKNLMGVMGENRGTIHTGFETKLVDICSAILPTLTIIDAYRILINNGPSGGSLSDVKLQKSLIASPCVVTADALALDLFDLSPAQVGYINEALKRGMNKFDPNKLNFKEIDLS
jgi:uncharacterized protein (DUF362 family)